MNPLGALAVLFPLTSSITVSESALWIGDAIKSCAQQGEMKFSTNVTSNFHLTVMINRRVILYTLFVSHKLGMRSI